MRVEMMDPQGVILGEIADKRMTRKSVALTYAWCIRQHEQCDFGTINRAIVNRWSLSALEWIKRWAWRWIEQQEGGR